MKLSEFRFRLIDRENRDSIVIGFNDLVPYEGECNDIYVTPYDKKIPKDWRFVSVQCDDHEVEIEYEPIAKKPILKSMDGFDPEVASQLVCPHCNKPIVNVWNTDEYKPNYCHYCGQKFDWSDDCIKPNDNTENT